MQSEMTKFLSGVYMGSAVFEEYYNKAKRENVKAFIEEILQSYHRHEESVKMVVDKDARLTLMENMGLYMEKMKLLKVNNDFALCKEMLNSMSMGISSAIEFMYEHRALNEYDKEIINGIIDDYDNQIKKLIILMKSL